MIYLATPYSHSEPEIRRARFDLVTHVGAHLSKEGQAVLSPITQGHLFCRYESLPKHYGFWKSICQEQLRACSALILLPLSGYKESIGVQDELAFAKRHNKPVTIWTNFSMCQRLFTHHETLYKQLSYVTTD